MSQTKYHVDHKNLFFTIVEAGKFKIKVPTWSDSGEGPLPGSESAASFSVFSARG